MFIRYVKPTETASPEAVEQAEAMLGFSIPGQYRDYLLSVANGGGIENAAIRGFPQISVNHILGVGRDDTDDLVKSSQMQGPLLNVGLLPIADAEGGNPICVSLRSTDEGSIWFVDHERHFDEPTALTRIADSWDEFLAVTEPDMAPTPADVKVQSVWISPELERMLREQFQKP